MALYGAIEAGGTKFVCLVGTGPEHIVARIQFATTTPDATLQRAIRFFRQYPVDALGVGCFGPLDLDQSSPTYGYILDTPKVGWSHTDVVGTLRKALDVPVVLDTDVNAAALGEHVWGAAQGVDTFVYVTVGTGIGGGAMTEGRLLHGLMHPEMGHMRIPHDVQEDPFPGICPYHGDCLEGLASGPAIAERWQRNPATLPPEHPAWTLEAHYLSIAAANLVTILSPKRIILGGGVMHQRHLFPRIRQRSAEILRGYISALGTADAFESFLVPPALGDNAGVLGALALARQVNSL